MGNEDHAEGAQTPMQKPLQSVPEIAEKASNMDGIGGAWPEASVNRNQSMTSSHELTELCQYLTAITPNAECTFVLVLSDTGSILRMGVDGWAANLDKRFTAWLGDKITSLTAGK